VIHPRTKLAALALTIVLTVSCGASDVLKSFRVALASSAPLVNSLVSSGAIPQAKAAAIIADFDAGAACGLTLQQSFNAIPKDAPNTKSQKLNASATALKCFRTVVARQNFASHPRVKQAADIAEGILASLVVFYSDDGPMRASAEGVATVRSASDEKALEERLKQQVDLLKDAMKP
jgi:hypothetical protein